MENKRRAELISVRVRWAILAAAVLMLEGRAPLLAIIFVGLVASLYNIAVWRACRDTVNYQRTGRRLAEVARALDIVVITSTILVPGGVHSNTYLLYTLVLLQAGFATARRRTIVALTCLASASYLTAAAVAASGLPDLPLLARGGLVALGGFLGLYLGEYRMQEEGKAAQQMRLATIYDCCMSLTSGQRLSPLLSRVLRSAVQEIDATLGYVMLSAKDNRDILLTEVAYSKHGNVDFPKECLVGEGLAGYVGATGQPLLVNAGEEDGLDASFTDHQPGAGCAIAAPLLYRLGSVDPSAEKQQEVVGVLVFHSAEPGRRFTEADLDFVRTLASMISVAAVNERMYEALRDTFLRTLEALANSLEARDEYTRGHSQRVCDLSMMLARHMGVCEEALAEIRVGTLLHDIGKIGIPDAVLNKPGRLTEEEFALMRLHTVIGYDICKPLGLNEGALMLIRNHHERLDGTGYPDGLKGGELPLSVRIVCVADAFDAMSSRRPYRDVMDEKLRLEQFNRFAGTQFDPVVVQVLKTLLREGKLDEMYQDHWNDVATSRDHLRAA
ncbi:MAG: HD domain-containing protein [Fimbriimonadia bacterium]|jgi:putative nucleotidyltransferase with HDIG domain